MQDLRDLLGEGLDLPIGGVTYHVAPPTGHVGLRLQVLRDLTTITQAGLELSKADAKKLRIDDRDEVDFIREALGDTYTQMVDGGVTPLELRVAASAAFLCFTASDPESGRLQAETYWSAQADPPRAATSQQATTPDLQGSTPLAAATTTRRPASMSGTTSRLGSKSKTKTKSGRSASSLRESA